MAPDPTLSFAARVLGLLLVLAQAGCTGAIGGGSAGPGDDGTGNDGASGDGDGTGAGDGLRDDGDDGPAEFQPISSDAALRKVKGMLTGLAPTEREFAALRADPEAMRALVTAFQQTPEYERRMRDFFTMAFQQGDVTAALINAVTPYEQSFMDDRVIQMMRESFGRTAFELVRENRPFTEVLTTRRFMLTPALMVAMAWLEERRNDDGGGFRDVLHEKLGPNAKYTMQASEPIAPEESADPASPNFLNYFSPQVAATSGDCRNPVVVDHENRLTLYTHTMGETLMMWFMGSRMQRGFCVYEAGQGILEPADFTTWRMMTIRQPNPGEEQTYVYELPKFRTGTELVFPKNHVGFYTTPSFLYTWQTNESNQARVTANQTLIAAIGRKFDGSLYAQPASEAALAPEHAAPNTDCYGCHITMDPMRQFFRSTFSLFNGVQENAHQVSMPGVYALEGVSRTGVNIGDLGSELAKSKRFAIGWVHKVCTWATGIVCDPSGDNLREPTDPEFVRIVKHFEDTNFDFNELVRELFSSPLVTGRIETATEKASEARLSIQKRAQLCRTFDEKLGLEDACGLAALPTTTSGDTVKTIATVLPSDSYSRGQTVPTLANDPGLFFYASVENICRALSQRIVGERNERFKTSDTKAAIADLVHVVMGISEADHDEPIAILTEHFEAAKAQGASEVSALRSTFMLSCLAPSSVGVGL